VARMLRISHIEDFSLVDGPGIRTVIFFAGCSHACPGCHNLELQNYNTKLASYYTVEDIVSHLADNIEYIDGITLSGGDPLFQIKEVKHLVDALKKHPLLKRIPILLYTGYQFEDIPKGFTQKVDVIIDGKYDKDLPPVKWAGSSNQQRWVRYAGTNRWTVKPWEE
jgi:anaerobic ribonucleoside-triphosphate reductase activating protein